MVHYVPDVEQTASALQGIKFLMAIVPAIAFFIGFVILAWDMTETRHKEIVDDLNFRRQSIQD